MKKNKKPLRVCIPFVPAAKRCLKKTAPVCIIFFICINVFTGATAQTFSTDYLLKTFNNSDKFVNSQVYDNGLRVGIGNPLPAEKLDVAGNIKAHGAFISDVTTGLAPMVVASSTLVAKFNSEYLNGFPAAYFSPANHFHSNMVRGHGITSQVAFWASDSVVTGANELFWDYSTHRLGIGTDAPDADLHLYSGGAQTSIYISATHTGALTNALTDSQWGVSNDAGLLKFNYFSGGQPINILKATGGSSGGTVEVNGYLKTNRFSMSQGAGANYILTSSASGAATWRSPLLATGWSISGGDVYKLSGYVGIGTQQMQARCNIRTNDVPAMIVTATQPDWGYGIIERVESPNVAAFAVEQSGQTTLMIWGDGRIHASKIRVKVPVFPDFVFDKQYPLSSIPDLQGYISKNGHLPGIPTAAEVESEGLDLGDMNTRLLQKIEELTLYVIQLYGENQDLRERMDAAESSLNNNR